MGALSMSREEREAFLADLHVGVLAIADGERGPLTAPVWYAYEPGGEIHIVTGDTSRKGRLLRPGLRVSLVAQTEDPPYKYVSVEGPVVAIEASDREKHLRPIARRYLGTEFGDAYVDHAPERPEEGTSVLVRIQPERWLTVDYARETLGQ